MHVEINSSSTCLVTNISNLSGNSLDLVETIQEEYRIWGHRIYFSNPQVTQWILFFFVGIGLTVVSLMGVFGNALSARILSKRAVKSPLYVLLLGLSYCDFIVCLYGFLMFGLAVISSQFTSLSWYIKWICATNVYVFPIWIMGNSNNVTHC
jgi:hypothetical protein